MAYLKKYYKLSEVVNIFGNYDPTIKTENDIKHLIHQGELSAQVEIKDCILIPADTLPFLKLKELNYKLLRNAYDRAIKETESTSLRQFIRRDYKKVLLKLRDLTFNQELFICTEDGSLKPIDDSDLQRLDLKTERLSENIDAGGARGCIPGILLSSSILVSPVNTSSAWTNPYEYLRILEDHDNGGLDMLIDDGINSKQLAKKMMSGYIMCTTSLNSSDGDQKKYYLVRRSPLDGVIRFRIDDCTIPNAVMNNDIYVTANSIMEFEQRHGICEHGLIIDSIKKTSDSESSPVETRTNPSDSALKVIGLLMQNLAETSPKYSNNGSPNLSQIKELLLDLAHNNEINTHGLSKSNERVLKEALTYIEGQKKVK